MASAVGGPLPSPFFFFLLLRSAPDPVLRCAEFSFIQAALSSRVCLCLAFVGDELVRGDSPPRMRRTPTTRSLSLDSNPRSLRAESFSSRHHGSTCGARVTAKCTITAKARRGTLIRTMQAREAL
jgi:hypothetical protein